MWTVIKSKLQKDFRNFDKNNDLQISIIPKASWAREN